MTPISQEEGAALAAGKQRMGVKYYMECSAKTQIPTLKNIFDQATRLAIEKQKIAKEEKSNCILL